MRRRSQRERRMPSRRGADLFQLVLALSATRPYFNADLYVIDGGSGKVRAAADYNGAADTHWLDQSDTTKQCALPSAHADFAGRLHIPFTGVEWYTSTRVVALWRWPHDFTGTHLVLVVTSTVDEANYYLSTASANSGIWLLGGGTSNQGTRITTKNAAGANNVNIIANGTAPAGTPTYIQVAQDQATSPQATLFAKGSSVGTSAIANAVHTGDPFSPLVLGRRADGLGNKSFRFRELTFAPTVGASGRALYEEYISKSFGIAA